MKTLFLSFLTMMALIAVSCSSTPPKDQTEVMKLRTSSSVNQEVETVYQFTVQDLYGKDVPLSEFEGKVLLIVNTASKCGLTPQLKGLESLYAEYKDRGLVVLGFPSNDFAGQEPLQGEAIEEFCTKNYGVTFPIFDKVVVKGKNACPLYEFLSDKSRNGKVSSTPMWNFHKYLVDREGRVQDFFISSTDPEAAKVRQAIEALL